MTHENPGSDDTPRYPPPSAGYGQPTGYGQAPGYGPPTGYGQPGAWPPSPRPGVWERGGYGALKPALPSQVNAASILIFIAGGLLIVFGFLLLALGLIAPVAIIGAAILLAIGGVHIWVGIALRQLKSRARITALVFAGLGVAGALVSLVRGGSLNILSMGVDVAIIVLLTRSESTQAFTRVQQY